MSKVIVFNGFQTVKMVAKVFNRFTKGVSSEWGYVVFDGQLLLVENMGSEWWGRTT